MKKKVFLCVVLLLAMLGSWWSGVGCLFRFVTGIPCPNCGMTRAFLSLFEGNVWQAFVWHPLFWLIPFVFWLAIFRDRWLYKTKAGRVTFGVILVLYFGVYLVRMLVLFPHTEPMTVNQDAFLLQFIHLILNLF